MKESNQAIVKPAIIAAVALLLIVLLLLPFKMTVAPERVFRIIDSDGQPIIKAFARQSWYQYSLGVKGVEQIEADENGRFRFAKRTIKTSGFALIIGVFSEIIEYKLSASVRSSDTINVFVDGFDSQLVVDGKGIETGVIKFDKNGQNS